MWPADCLVETIVDGTADPDLSLRHLRAELARLDARLRREVARWQRAGQDPTDAFRGLYVSDEQANALLERPLGATWGHADILEDERTWDEMEQQAAQHARSVASEAMQAGHPTRLTHLAQAFGLDPFEIDTLLIALAPALDLRYQRLYGYLQDDVTRKHPTVSLALDLLCTPDGNRLGRLRHFAGNAPLFRHHLLAWDAESGAEASPLLAWAFSVDETVAGWLLGHYSPPTDLLPYVRLEHSPADDFAPSLPADHVEELARAAGELAIIVLHGADRLRQREAAGQLTDHFHRPLLAIDLAGIIEAGISAERALELAARDAALTHAIPLLLGWEACLGDGTPPHGLLRRLCDFPGPAIVSGATAWQPEGIARRRPFRWFEFAIPNYAERHALWSNALTADEKESAEELRPLAGQFLLTAGQIRDAAATARDAATQRGEALTERDLFAAARIHSNPRLTGLARKITPRYGWSDIILPSDQLALLREIIATVRSRPRVLEEWGVGQKLASSRGVTLLFAGPPGTGKTMAAEIIAGELGLELYKIDLSMVISKYIGETEKNLERIFVEAAVSNAILFFDEADALFGKRSEVRDSHDRYANIEISFLLQRMEAYDGVTILATNLRANLDEAFTRRLQFAVDFPFPEAEDRLRIWTTLFPAGVPRQPDLDLDLLARRFKLAGGSIRNILVSAAYLAAADGGQMNMAHLLHGTRRELQKMGRLVADEDMIAGARTYTTDETHRKEGA